MSWKNAAVWHDNGYFTLSTKDTGDVPLRLFLTPELLYEAEEALYPQLVNATRFPSVKLVYLSY